MRGLALALVPLMFGGCVAKTVVGVATAPVRVASKAVDWTTTSRDEADRNAGRKARKAKKHCRNHPDDCRIDPQLVPRN